MKYDIFCKIFISILVVFFICITVIGAKPYLEQIKEGQAKMQEIHTETILLASLDYTTNIEGEFRSSFTMGRGRIDTVDYYVAYEVLQDGGKRLVKIPSDNTIIYNNLDNSAQAYAEIDKNGYGIQAYRLYVPKNTITQEYDLSLH